MSAPQSMTNQQLREQLAQSVYEKIVHKMRDRQLCRADAVRETISETSAGVLPWSDALKRIDEEFGAWPPVSVKFPYSNKGEGE